jgi:AcrR family transcriptional regulator
MGTKAENTKEFILEKVSPIFNQKGYVGTSLADITNATQLTKGAIYGNFENKEDLALQAFKHNIRKIIHPLNHNIANKTKCTDKLFAIT